MLVGALGCWALSGCQSRTTGNEGELVFSYVADDELLDFNKPLAVGALLDIEVRRAGSNRPVTLQNAEIRTFFQLVTFSGSRLTIRAVAPGNALLEVDAITAEGERVTDSINLLTRNAQALRLSHTCVDEGVGRYLINSRILIPFELEDIDGPIIGYGLYPVRLSNPTALLRDTSIRAQVFLHYDTSSTPSPITIRSEIDDTTLMVTTIAPTDIDGAEILVGNAVQRTGVGDRHAYFALPTVQGGRVCQSTLTKTVESLTPEVCRAEDRAAPVGNSESGWLWITGLQAGVCRVGVSYPAVGQTFEGQVVIGP